MIIYLAITKHSYGSDPDIKAFQDYSKAVDCITRYAKSYDFIIKDGCLINKYDENDDDPEYIDFKIYKKNKIKSFDMDGGPCGYIKKTKLKS